MFPAVPDALAPDVVKPVSGTVAAIRDGPTTNVFAVGSKSTPGDGHAESSHVGRPALRKMFARSQRRRSTWYHEAYTPPSGAGRRRYPIRHQSP